MHGTKQKYTRRGQVYEPEGKKKYYKQILVYDPNDW